MIYFHWNSNTDKKKLYSNVEYESKCIVFWNRTPKILGSLLFRFYLWQLWKVVNIFAINKRGLTKRYEATVEHRQLDAVGNGHQAGSAWCSEVLLLRLLLHVVSGCRPRAVFPLAGRDWRAALPRSRRHLGFWLTPRISRQYILSRIWTEADAINFPPSFYNTYKITHKHCFLFSYCGIKIYGRFYSSCFLKQKNKLRERN